MKIHSFESMASLDGEGIRYGIFLPGCPLRCAYCHNPDTWDANGIEFSPQELFKKILRYKPYFGKLGGVTFSGGEPLLHAKDINETAALLKTENINYTLDTSGCIPLSNDVKQAVDNASLVICDLKMWNDEYYKKYTGMDMTYLRAFLSYTKEKNIRMWLRTVIVPGINDSTDALDRYLKIVNQYTNIEKYELLAFHTMGFYKYEQLNIQNPLLSYDALPKDTLSKLQAYCDIHKLTR